MVYAQTRIHPGELDVENYLTFWDTIRSINPGYHTRPRNNYPPQKKKIKKNFLNSRHFRPSRSQNENQRKQRKRQILAREQKTKKTKNKTKQNKNKQKTNKKPPTNYGT